MKTLILTLSLTLATVASAAEPIPQLTLSTGQVYHRVRIVAIKGDTVAIVHANGAEEIPAAAVDLEILARAHMQIQEQEERRKEQLARIAQKAAEAEEDQRDRLAAALAMAAVREGRHLGVQPDSTAPATPSTQHGRKSPKSASARPVNVEQRMAELKAGFPPKVPGSVRVFIPRSGQNRKPYIVWSTVSDMPDGRRYASTTTQHNAGQGRVDTIQYTAPSDEVWGWYRGMIQTTTAQALPRTLQMIEARIAEDTAKCHAVAGGLSMSAAAQAQHTLYWFEHSLRPYLKKWSALLR